MNYDRNYTSAQITKAFLELVSEKSLAERLQNARLKLSYFAEEENWQDLGPESRHFLNEIMEVEDFGKLKPGQQLAAASLFTDFILFAKADLNIAEYKQKQSD